MVPSGGSNDCNLVIEYIKNIIMIRVKHTVHISRLANLAEQHKPASNSGVLEANTLYGQARAMDGE